MHMRGECKGVSMLQSKNDCFLGALILQCFNINFSYLVTNKITIPTKLVEKKKCNNRR